MQSTVSASCPVYKRPQTLVPDQRPQHELAPSSPGVFLDNTPVPFTPSWSEPGDHVIISLLCLVHSHSLTLFSPSTRTTYSPRLLSSHDMSGSPSSLRKSRMASASNVLYTNAVYWPNHRVYNGDTPGALNYGCINRVYYAFANVTADGGVFVSLSRIKQGLPR